MSQGPSGPQAGEPGRAPASMMDPEKEGQRQAIEALKDVVLQEHAYRSLRGAYTRRMDQLGLSGEAADQVVAGYRLQVSEASLGKLWVVARGIQRMGTSDSESIWMDQDFRIYVSGTQGIRTLTRSEGVFPQAVVLEPVDAH